MESDVVFYENSEDQLHLGTASTFEKSFKGGGGSSLLPPQETNFTPMPRAAENELRTFTETTLDKRSLINQTLNSITIDSAYLLSYAQPSSSVNYFSNG